jgi:hypothetical protein
MDKAYRTCEKYGEYVQIRIVKLKEGDSVDVQIIVNFILKKYLVRGPWTGLTCLGIRTSRGPM